MGKSTQSYQKTMFRNPSPLSDAVTKHFNLSQTFTKKKTLILFL